MKFLRFTISAIIRIGILLAILFLGAGRWDYWQGWGLTILMLMTAVVGLIIFRKREDLIKERNKPGPGMKTWDKVFWIFNVVLYFAILIIGILDGGRFGWTESIPLWAYVVSYVGYFIGTSIVFWGMWTNNYFSSVVRIQKDRGQKVVTDGPYKIVRHPGYVGASILMLALGPILGSLWAMIPGGLWVISIIIRTHLEDLTLQKELEGYKEYTKKTKYKLIPGIWSLLIAITVLNGCSQPVEWLTYEGPWFDIQYPSNFTIADMGYGENYDGATFINNDSSCVLHVFSPQWAGFSAEEEALPAEKLISEENNGEVTNRVVSNTINQFQREIEIHEENDGTVRYMFFYGHPTDKDPCRNEYEKFKGSIIQYAD